MGAQSVYEREAFLQTQQGRKRHHSVRTAAEGRRTSVGQIGVKVNCLLVTRPPCHYIDHCFLHFHYLWENIITQSAAAHQQFVRMSTLWQFQQSSVINGRHLYISHYIRSGMQVSTYILLWVWAASRRSEMDSKSLCLSSWFSCCTCQECIELTEISAFVWCLNSVGVVLETDIGIFQNLIKKAH